MLAASLDAMRAVLDASYAGLAAAEATAHELPHRQRVIAVNQRFARRLLDAHVAWLEEAEAELSGAAARRS